METLGCECIFCELQLFVNNIPNGWLIWVYRLYTLNSKQLFEAYIPDIFSVEQMYLSPWSLNISLFREFQILLQLWRF
jgi:hypothetical protein